MSTATASEQIQQQIVSRDERRIHDIIAALHRAHYVKDASAAASPYAPNASVFNLAPPLEHHGVSVEEKQAWMDTWATPIELTPRSLKVRVSGDFAFAHCFLELKGTKKGPEGHIHFWMRETMAFERIDGVWLIVQEHASVPFYMDGTSRPAFDLQPEAA